MRITQHQIEKIKKIIQITEQIYNEYKDIEKKYIEQNINKTTHEWHNIQNNIEIYKGKTTTLKEIIEIIGI